MMMSHPLMPQRKMLMIMTCIRSAKSANRWPQKIIKTMRLKMEIRMLMGLWMMRNLRLSPMT